MQLLLPVPCSISWYALIRNRGQHFYKAAYLSLHCKFRRPLLKKVNGNVGSLTSADVQSKQAFWRACMPAEMLHNGKKAHRSRVNQTYHLSKRYTLAYAVSFTLCSWPHN